MSPKTSAASDSSCSSVSMSPPSELSRSSVRISSSLWGWLPASEAGGTPNGLRSRFPIPLKRSTSGFVAR